MGLLTFSINVTLDLLKVLPWRSIVTSPKLGSVPGRSVGAGRP